MKEKTNEARADNEARTHPQTESWLPKRALGMRRMHSIKEIEMHFVSKKNKFLILDF